MQLHRGADNALQPKQQVVYDNGDQSLRPAAVQGENAQDEDIEPEYVDLDVVDATPLREPALLEVRASSSAL